MIFFLNLRTTNSYLQTRFILTFTTAVYIAFTATIIIVIIITPIYILQLIYWILLPALLQNFDFVSQTDLKFVFFFIFLLSKLFVTKNQRLKYQHPDDASLL